VCEVLVCVLATCWWIAAATTGAWGQSARMWLLLRFVRSGFAQQNSVVLFLALLTRQH
jgi:hypothetical protein